MNVSLGIYDIFAHLVPGILILYILNEFLALFKVSSIDVSKLESPVYFVVFLIAAYILGNLGYIILDRLWYHRVSRALRGKALEDIKKSSGMEVKLQVSELTIITEVLRLRNVEALHEVDRHKVNSIMMRNISLCLLLFSLLQAAYAVTYGTWWPNIVLAVIVLLLIPFAYKLAEWFDRWYYRAIFAQALTYGCSLKDLLHNDKPCWKDASPPAVETSTSS